LIASADSFVDWSSANEWYRTFYDMEIRYHEAMASRPPQVEAAFNVFRQMWGRTAWALTEKQNEKIKSNLDRVRANLFDPEYAQYSWAFSIQSRRRERMQESIDLLSEAQRDLFEAMDKKKMLIPRSAPPRGGYSTIGPGGVMD
jgi:hypothetical protein